ncbi:CAP domain-containing protein [Streptomyces sp. NPDC020681]|uniref:CAP domain-containing protein n=1 Tax=Streptomyces sp. NPDC020681 TaxID=3365083 RepID=UPI003796D527
MSSRSPHTQRHPQQSSHARPKRLLRTRNVALALSAVTVTACVGVGAASAGIIPGGSKGHAKTNTAKVVAGKADAAAKKAGTPRKEWVSSTALPKSTLDELKKLRELKRLEDLKKLREKISAPKPPKARPTPTKTPTARPAPAPSAPANGGSGGSTAAPGAPADSTEAQVIALVNKERAAAGCSPVKENPNLTRAADRYSTVMAKSGVMSHTGPDGSTMVTRVEAAGYASWSNVGENIAMGQRDAGAVMKAWMNSAGHKANILNCAFKEIGVGVDFGSGGPWWTQNFGTRR